MIVKVCGMRDPQNINTIASLNIQWMGFIFYEPSPRFVEKEQTKLPLLIETMQALPESIARVGVFVNASIEYILRMISTYDLNLVQLHGHESPELCQALQALGTKVIKAFPIKEVDDLKQTAAYRDVCDYFLFDTKTAQHGGSGLKFDWRILDNYHETVPFLLSGGIGIESKEDVRRFNHPHCVGVDLNSCFETAPGIKDYTRLHDFISDIE